jgi:hypothetical protein
VTETKSKRPASAPEIRDALKIEEIGETSTEGVEAELVHKQFIVLFGG